MKKIHKLSIMPVQFTMPKDHLDRDNLVYRSQHFWKAPYLENWPVYPLGIEDAIRKKATWFRDAYCRFQMIILALEGEVIYKIQNQRFRLHGNNVLLIPPGCEFYFETGRKPFYRKLSLFLLGVNLPGIMETLNLSQPEMIAVPDTEQIVQTLLKLDELIAAQHDKDMPEMAGMVMKLLYKLSEYKTRADDDLMLLRIIKSRLDANFERQMNIADIAKELRISTRTLNRIFNDKFQITPREYRLQCRINKARELLTYSNLSIKEISQQLGYCNQFYFSNEFKRITGQSPRELRMTN